MRLTRMAAGLGMAALRARGADSGRDALAASLLGIVAGTMAAALTGAVWPAMLAAGAYLGFLGVGLAFLFGRRERLLAGAAALVAAAVLATAEDPAPVLADSFRQACHLATFLLTLGFLRDAAQGSRLVRTCGAFLAGQPPGRRYIALSLGSHLLGVVLNFGTINLLGTLVLKGNTAAAAGNDLRIVEIRRQRMMGAIMRGFSVILLWAPTTISQALMLNVVAGLRWQDSALPGFLVALGMVLLGWLMDRLEWRRARAMAPARAQPVAGGPASVLKLAGLVALLLAGVGVLHAALGRPLVVTVMTVVPLFALVWMFVQFRRVAGLRAAPLVGRRLQRIVRRVFPASWPEVMVLSSAGFIGAGLSALIPPALVSDALERLNLPEGALLVGIALLIPLAAQIAVSPIVTVTVLGTAVSRIAEPYAPDPGSLALALAGGWTLALVTSPLSATVLIVGRLVGRPAGRLAREWNLRYAVAAFLLLAAVLVLR